MSLIKFSKGLEKMNFKFLSFRYFHYFSFIVLITYFNVSQATNAQSPDPNARTHLEESGATVTNMLQFGIDPALNAKLAADKANNAAECEPCHAFKGDRFSRTIPGLIGKEQLMSPGTLKDGADSSPGSNGP